jgi:hypothetical protein
MAARVVEAWRDVAGRSNPPSGGFQPA